MKKNNKMEGAYKAVSTGVRPPKEEAAVLPGFSERFGQLLDMAGYPSVNSGRLTELSEDLGVSVSGVRKWVASDKPPRTAKLIEICELIVNIRMNKDGKGSARLNPRKIACWLEFGEELVRDPFKGNTKQGDEHVQMGQLYVAVHRAALKKELNLYTINPSLVDFIYSTLLDDMKKSNSSAPNEELLNTLISSAKAQSKQ